MSFELVALILVAFVSAVALLNLAVRRRNSGRWHLHHSIVHGDIMRRRRPDGRWETRALTDRENYDDQHDSTM